MRKTKKIIRHDRADAEAIKRSSLIDGLMSDNMRFDDKDDASVFFARELDHVKTESYDVQYPEFTALNKFPISHEVAEGAETVTYYGYENTGMAKIISNYATDLPRADVKGMPTTALIKSIGNSYGYSVQEMRASRLAGKGLDTRKAKSARYQSDRTTNTIAWRGDEDKKLIGLISKNNNVPLYTLDTVKHSGFDVTEWKYKSAQEILTDINSMTKYQAKLTKNVEKSDTLFLPSTCFIDISTRQIPNTETTVKKFLMENAPYLKAIIDCPELEEDSEETNPYGKNVAVMCKLSEEKFTLENPLEFLQYPVQTEGLEMVVPCESRTAGIIIYYPLSILIAVGI